MVELTMSNIQNGVTNDAHCSPRPTVSSSQIKTQAKFYSFADFENAFDRWKQELHHPFRVASSETLRMPDGTSNNLFRYRYIVYHCAHYGNPRMRGVGKRPNQNYLPCGCKAMLRLNYSWSENCLRITTLNDIHSGHEVSQDAFSKFTNKPRRSFTATASNPPSSSGSTVGSPSPANTEGSGRAHSRGSSVGSPVLGSHANNNVPMQDSTPASMNPSSAFRPLTGPFFNTLAQSLLFRQPIHQDPFQQLANAMGLMQSPRNVLPPTTPSLFPNASSNNTLLALLSSNSFRNNVLPTPAIPAPSQAQAAPIDLSNKDRRSDEDRFQVVHPVLQNLTDHLITCQGNEFDNKIVQLRTIIKSWNCKTETEYSPMH